MAIELDKEVLEGSIDSEIDEDSREAARVQDRIRKEAGNWNSTEKIRKWRQD